MSANNQVLIKEFEGKWYVFNNVMAESWANNTLYLEEATASFDTKEEALVYAHKIDEKIDEMGYPNSEYGVWVDCLAKDNTKIKIIKKL